MKLNATVKKNEIDLYVLMSHDAQGNSAECKAEVQNRVEYDPSL